jgi:hypothetical protein
MEVTEMQRWKHKDNIMYIWTLSVAWQQLDYQVSAAANTWRNNKELLEAVFL